MGKRNTRGQELSFKPYKGKSGAGRWYKTIKGREVYFGAGSTRSDREGYRAALESYKVHTGQQARDQAQSKGIATLVQLLEATGGGRLAMPLETFRELLPDLGVLPPQVVEAYSEIGDNEEKTQILDDLAR